MADYFDGHYLKSWGTAASAQGFGTAYRKIDNPGGDDLQEYLWAAGFGMGEKVSFGGSFRHFSAGPPEFHKRHLWNLGTVVRIDPTLTFGATFNNLNKGKLNGVRTQIEQQYSLAYRPMHDLVTLSANMLLGNKQNMSEASFIYHAEVRPIDGLYISGYIDSDRNYQIGARVNLRRTFVGIFGRFNRSGDDRGTTTVLGTTSARQASVIPYEKQNLTVSIGGPVRENPPQPIFGHKDISFTTLLLSLYRAANDQSIESVVLNLHDLQVGFAQAQELRSAVMLLRSRGKQVTAYLSYPNNISYYLASAADSIVMPPVSQLNLVGLRAELTFYAGTLEKIGVKADMIRIGDHKTAVEPWTNRESSEANREQINRLLDDLYGQLASGIAQGRSLSPDSVKNLIDNGPLNCEEALRAGLIDKLAYAQDYFDTLSRHTNLTSLRRYIDDTLYTDSWEPKPVIAVVVADGDIGDLPGTLPFQEDNSVSAGSMGSAFRDALKNRQVKGILFRVNSPGGFALVGEDIWNTAQHAAQKKPTVVSLGNVAASGGYYIAMASPTVIANPGTITGSIGIFGGKLDMSGLNGKLDLGKELYQRGKFSAMLSTSRPFTDDEREKYFQGLHDFYQHFISLVARNRDLAVDSIDALGQGQVWTGNEAKANGLVDGLGGLKEALDNLIDKSNVQDYGVELYPRVRPWFRLPGQSFLTSISDKLFGKEERKAATTLLSMHNGAMFTRMPYDITIE